MEKAVIIGSGVSGLSIAKMLNDKFEIQILEKTDKAGGLIKCDRIEGNLFHKVGGHVFNSKNKIVLNWFWNHFDRDKEFINATRNAKIFLNEKIIGYPLENFLFELPEEDAKAIIEELIVMLGKKGTTEIVFNNFKEFLIGNFGENLYRIYFGPYNSKLWNTDLNEVPLEWLDGKLPMPQIKDIIINNIIKKGESNMVHASFFYPKRNGSQFIVDRLAEQLNIKLSYKVFDISIDSEKQILINKGDIFCKLLVYCGDIRQLHNIINIDDLVLKTLLKKVVHLKSNGTSNVLCETDESDISWMYLPDKKFKAHRIIYTGNFSATNNEGTKRKTCVVEFSGEQTKELMVGELKKLPGNLTPLAFNYEPNSYIIQDKDTRQNIIELKKILENYNIYLLGRFAEWEYYNMDKAIEAAMELNSKLS